MSFGCTPRSASSGGKEIRILANRQMRIETHLKTRPNWLLRGLIIPSVCLHLVIFLHIAGLYHSNAVSYIEIAIRDISAPEVRNIPRPRLRPDPQIRPKAVEEIKLNRIAPPAIQPIRPDPAEKSLPDSLVEAISADNPVSNLPGLQIGQWQAEPIAGGDFGTAEDYFEMVRLKIEQFKRYPVSAQNRHIEGRITVEFAIDPDGTVSSIEISKSSRHKILDDAAVEAIRKASPFPAPPTYIFTRNQPVRLVLAVVFELT